MSQITVSNVPLPINTLSETFNGSGVIISSINYQINNGGQFGEYSDSSSSSVLSFTEGLVLSTGSAQSIIGPNVSDSINTSGPGFGTINDPDIDILAGGQTYYDNAIVEMDVEVKGDRLFLDLSFMSDEYPEKVCSNQGDIFGVIISGPGLSGPYSNGGVLMSTAPGSSDPLGINTVNPGVAGSQANGACNANSFNNASLYNANMSPFLEMDGYTNVITISAPVQCDSIYRLKIFIADIGDHTSESALVIRNRGLYASGVHPAVNPLYNDSSIVEGCKPFSLDFQRPAGGGTETVQLSISGTATQGTDYSITGMPLTFSPGDSVITLVIEAFDDGIVESPESVFLNYSYTNTCGQLITEQFGFWILDQPSNPLMASYPIHYANCEGDPVLLEANISGGLPPYNVLWGDLIGNGIMYNPGKDTTLLLNIYDQAACAIFAYITIESALKPDINAGPDISICKNEHYTFPTVVNSNGSSYDIEWTPSLYLDQNDIEQPSVINPQQATTYAASITTEEGCTSIDSVSITPLQIPFVSAAGGGTIVYGQTTIGIWGSAPNANFLWTPGHGLDCYNCTNAVASPLQDTWYHFVANNSNGCQNSDSVFVEVTVPKDVFVPNSFSPNSDGKNDLLYVRGYTIESMIFRVFDQWGTEVFTSRNRFYGWDGNINGTEAAPGTYVYTLDVIFVNNEGTASSSGEITMVR